MSPPSATAHPEPTMTAAVWLHPDQRDLVRGIAEHAGLRIIAAGTSAEGSARSGELAAALDAEPITDLRHALASIRADVFLLAAADRLGERPEDLSLLKTAEPGESPPARASMVASFEPLPASVIELADLAGGDGSTSTGSRLANARFLPLSRASRLFRDSADVLTEFGQVHAAAIQCVGSPIHGTLGARLLDALDLSLHLVGEAESAVASFAAFPPGPRGAADETLRGLHGTLTGHLRTADGRSITILASDRAGRWRRQVTLIGDKGRLIIGDGDAGPADGFEWLDPNGCVIDRSRPPTKAGRRSSRTGSKAGSSDAAAEPAPDAFAAAVVDQLVARHDTLFPPLRPSPELARLLAVGQAALLSARTGQGESPATFRRMVAG